MWINDALCECGCGQPAPIAKLTNRAKGHKAGQPVRFLPGHNQKTLGMVETAEHRAKISKSRLAEKHPLWKGDQVGYSGLHMWLRSKYPKSGVCDQCGETARTTYALVHGRSYSRERSDYLELCYRCHNIYDRAAMREAGKE